MRRASVPQVSTARLREVVAQLRAAIDRGDCTPRPEELRALNALCRRRGIRSPFRRRVERAS
jgi:hypothetical protein